MSVDRYGIKSCYNSNVNLKKAGITIEITQEEKDEYLKCYNDVEYFLSNYCYITDLDNGQVKFKPFKYQKNAIKIMDKNRFSIFLMSRQMGKTTTVAGYLLHSAIFNKNFTIAVLAHLTSAAQETLQRMQDMYEMLPWFLQPGVKVWNKRSILLGNGTKVFIGATTASSVRGKSINILYLDEFAYVNNGEDFYSSAFPVVSSGKSSKIIITSTPQGMNLFYKLWTEAVSGKNGFKPLRVDWHHHPRRDAKWKEQICSKLSERQFNQEFGNEFIGSADTLITGEKLSCLAGHKPIKEDKLSKIYKEPVSGRSYVLTADVSEGVGKDSSVANIFDVTETPYEQVAIYKNDSITPLMFAYTIEKIAKKYNDATVVVENNSIGSTVCSVLWNDIEYDNILRTMVKRSESTTNSGYRSEIGLRMTPKSKSLGCSNLKDLIERDVLKVVDDGTIQELMTFVKTGTSYSAEKGKHDDIVMTLVSLAWFIDQPYFEDMVNINTRGVLKQKMEQDEAPPSIFFDDGLGGNEFGAAGIVF